MLIKTTHIICSPLELLGVGNCKKCVPNSLRSNQKQSEPGRWLMKWIYAWHNKHCLASSHVGLCCWLCLLATWCSGQFSAWSADNVSVVWSSGERPWRLLSSTRPSRHNHRHFLRFASVFSVHHVHNCIQFVDVTGLAWSICLFLLVITMSHTKTAESIEVSFRIWMRMAQVTVKGHYWGFIFEHA